MGMKIYVDVDEQGNILLPYLAGTSVVTDKEYDYSFEIDDTDKDMANLRKEYRVLDGELVPKTE